MLVVGRTCEVGQQTFPIHARKRIRNYPCDQCLDRSKVVVNQLIGFLGPYGESFHEP
jgi:hypothetical protein